MEGRKGDGAIENGNTAGPTQMGKFQVHPWGGHGRDAPARSISWMARRCQLDALSENISIKSEEYTPTSRLSRAYLRTGGQYQGRLTCATATNACEAIAKEPTQQILAHNSIFFCTSNDSNNASQHTAPCKLHGHYRIDSLILLEHEAT